MLSSISIHGFARNSTAYRIAEPREFTKIKSLLYLDSTGGLAPSISFGLAGWLYYDAVFDMTDTFDDIVEEDMESEAELRKAFIDIGIGNWELRIGKQQIVWGQAVGLFFADIVNPKDLREFILPELEEVRIPVWAVDVEYFVGASHFELVWVPFVEFNDLGVPGSEFAFRLPELPSGATTLTDDLEEPEDNFQNSVYGIRLSHFLRGWDLSAFYLYGYDYFPVLFRDILIDPSSQSMTVRLKPEYKRLHIIGATFSKEVKDIILKGEFVFNKGRYFSVEDLADGDGVTKKDYFEYLLGLDYTFFRKIDANLQFFQQIVIDPPEDVITDPLKTFCSVWLQTGFMENRLQPEIFFVSNLERKEYMLRPRINYVFAEGLEVAVGMDIFGGDESGDFGQFDDADRVYLELRYNF